MKIHFKIKIHNSADEKMSTFVAAYFFLQSLNLFIKLGLGGAAWSSIALRVCMGILLLRCLVILWRKSSVSFFFGELIISFLFLFTYLMGTYNEDFSSIVFNTLVVFTPMAFCVFSIDCLETLFKRLYFFAWISLAALWVTCIINRLGNYDYIMSLGYSIAFHTIILLDSFFCKHKKIDLIGCFISALFILAMGSRGPLLVLLVYVLLKILFSNSLSRNYKFVISILMISLFIVLWLYRNNIVVWLNNYLNTIGFKSRTLRSILNATFTNDSGRSRVFSYYMELISKKPLLGYGIVGGWKSSGGYPHNIAIEMILSFGYPLGLLFLGAIVIIILKSIFTKDPDKQRLTMIFLSLSISLLFSGSFVTAPEFYILIAVCFKSILATQYRSEAAYE